jgi:hypothetical protein
MALVQKIPAKALAERFSGRVFEGASTRLDRLGEAEL